ncbi:hypothetical protein AHIS1_p074 [Acaryochloris phage A-HIS1]|nr:hypothetical protein AHIS1_p074 [Acaryochloris phage A-HIS1]
MTALDSLKLAKSKLETIIDAEKTPHRTTLDEYHSVIRTIESIEDFETPDGTFTLTDLHKVALSRFLAVGLSRTVRTSNAGVFDILPAGLTFGPERIVITFLHIESVNGNPNVYTFRSKGVSIAEFASKTTIAFPIGNELFFPENGGLSVELSNADETTITLCYYIQNTNTLTPSIITPLTKDFDGISWLDVDSSTALSNAAIASARIDVLISNASEGIILETGGRTFGTALYVTNGSLYLEAGRGNRTGSRNDNAFIEYELPEDPTNLILEFTINAPQGIAALYANGMRIGYDDSWSNDYLGGSNPGRVGDIASVVRETQSGGNVPLSNAVVTFAEVYRDAEITL